tara:strand:- start:1813 stop:2076 length:264 start_codon:yes stop_codon:yes gene_type:complete
MDNQTKKLINEIAHARTLLEVVKDKLDGVYQETYYAGGMGSLDSAVMQELVNIACDLRNTIDRSDIAIKKRSEIEDYVRNNAHLGIK